MLKGKLKEALKNAGLNEELAERINITSESQIEGIVISLQSTQSTTLDFNAVLSSSEFSEFVDKNGFDKVVELSKALQGGHDKKVTQGIKTFQDKYFKKIDEDGSQEQGVTGNTGIPGVPGTRGDDTGTPAWAKLLIDKVGRLEESKEEASKLEQAQKLLQNSNLSDTLKTKWVGRLNLDSETSLEDQVKSLEVEYDELHTSIVGSRSGQGLPLGGKTNAEASDELINEVADSLV